MPRSLYTGNMYRLPLSLYRAEQVRELDRLAIEEHGVPGYKLMSNAGLAGFNALKLKWPAAHNIVVLCGIGNNGGDGYVIARLAKEAGMEVKVICLGDRNQLKGDALQAYKDWEENGGVTSPFDSQQVDIFEQAEVIVDAVLGTGLEREVKDDWRAAIEAVNNDSIPVLSIDIPSGLHSDTGVVMGAAIQADLSISFIGLKQGMFTGQGPDYCGDILFDDLDVPPEIYLTVPSTVTRLDESLLKILLPGRKRTSHKGDFGHVLVIGGDFGMSGAALMAGEAAARSGAGLVSVATRPEHAAIIAAARPELMCHGIESDNDLIPLLQKATVVVIGPGLGQSQWAQQIFSRIIDSEKPLVVDADALHLLSSEPIARGNWVLTPHPGEAARMLKCENKDIQKDRFAALEALTDAYGGVCVLKGSGTLISSLDKEVYLCDQGNPGMASGGMGDVLTGIIAALISQGLELDEAACAGVYIHASAADAAAGEGEGERGLLASDLMDQLRWIANPDHFTKV